MKRVDEIQAVNEIIYHEAMEGDINPLSLQDNNYTPCPICGAICGVPEWAGHTVYLWANQYGWKKRGFCNKCGCNWTFTEGKLIGMSWRGEAYGCS